MAESIQIKRYLKKALKNIQVSFIINLNKKIHAQPLLNVK